MEFFYFTASNAFAFVDKKLHVRMPLPFFFCVHSNSFQIHIPLIIQHLFKISLFFMFRIYFIFIWPVLGVIFLKNSRRLSVAIANTHSQTYWRQQNFKILDQINLKLWKFQAEKLFTLNCGLFIKFKRLICIRINNLIVF